MLRIACDSNLRPKSESTLNRNKSITSPSRSLPTPKPLNPQLKPGLNPEPQGAPPPPQPLGCKEVTRTNEWVISLSQLRAISPLTTIGIVRALLTAQPSHHLRKNPQKYNIFFITSVFGGVLKQTVGMFPLIGFKRIKLRRSVVQRVFKGYPRVLPPNHRPRP